MGLMSMPSSIDSPFPHALDTFGDGGAQVAVFLVDVVGVGRTLLHVGMSATWLPMLSVVGAFEQIGVSCCGAHKTYLALMDAATFTEVYG